MGRVNYSGTYATPRLDLGVAFMEFMRAPDQYIATSVLPIFRTPKQAANYAALKRATRLATADVKRSSGGGYNRVTFGATDKSYSCEERGLEGVVDDRDRALYMSDFDHDMATMETVAEKILIAQEIAVAALIQDPTTNWPSGNSALYTDVSAAPWDTAASGVIAHVQAAKEKVRRLTGMVADTLILAESQFQNLLANTGIIARFPGSTQITEQMIMANIAGIFGLKKILRGKAVKNTASEGETEVLADVWSDDYALVCRTASGEGASLVEPCIGRTFLWTPDSAELLTVDEYREEQVRGKVIRVRHDSDEVVVDSSYGHLLKID